MAVAGSPRVRIADGKKSLQTSWTATCLENGSDSEHPGDVFGAAMAEVRAGRWNNAEQLALRGIALLSGPGLAAVVDTTNEHDQTMLHLMCLRGTSEIVQALLAVGADVNRRDVRGHTPLDTALAEGHLHLLAPLLRRKAEAAGFGEVHRLVMSGNADAIRRLTIDRPVFGYSVSPLFIAAVLGDEDVVRAVLSLKPDVDEKGPALRCALHVAAREGHAGVVTALLSAGADPNAADEKWHTALHHALLGKANQQRPNAATEVLNALLGDAPKSETSLLSSLTSPLQRSRRLSSPTLSSLPGTPRKVDVNGKDIMGCTPLHFAAESGDEPVATRLIKAGADVNAVTVRGRTALHYAAKAGHASVVRTLLKAGAYPLALDCSAQIPLHLAAASGHLKAVKALARQSFSATDDFLSRPENLLMLGVDTSGSESMGTATDWTSSAIKLPDVNFRDQDGYTPLHLAAYNGHPDVCAALLDSKAGRTVRDARGKTPLHLAAEAGHTAAVQALLDGRAEIDARIAIPPDPDAAIVSQSNPAPSGRRRGSATPMRMGATALHLAVEAGHDEVVVLLLSRGAYTGEADADGRTPVHIAVEKGLVPMLERLLPRHAEVNAYHADGRTLLHRAMNAGHPAVVDLLLSRGADPLARTCTPSHTTCTMTLTSSAPAGRLDARSRAHKDRDKASPHLVLGRSPDARRRSRSPSPAPLGGAGETDGVGELAKGDVPGTSVLEIGMLAGHLDAVRALLRSRKAASSVDEEDVRGRRALHLAALVGNTAMVDVLIEHGAKVDAVDEQGRTALHVAVATKHLPGVVRLLQAKASANILDDAGETALHVACAKGYRSIVKELLRGSADASMYDAHGRAAMHISAVAGNTQVLEVLLAMRCAVDIRTSDTKETPLLLAARGGHVSAVEVLLHAGANVMLRDSKQRLPYHVCPNDATRQLIAAHMPFLFLHHMRFLWSRLSKQDQKRTSTPARLAHRRTLCLCGS